ncbi:DUF5677 domain-containing protein [Dyadobacter tibetensis]|uniref:DUF5677 domain-containing protein n=1 Tax=Dyadobacter tibetensis TaxID=1211851 RepID=UPI0004708847|nr:DUF5677 domain-containing protein [Dyadobacter tibetensis]
MNDQETNMSSKKETKYYFEPNEELIPRNLTPDLEKYFYSYGRVLDEIVNFGSQVLSWRVQHENGEYLNIPLMLIRDVMDLTDSCSLLLYHGAADPAKILARSLFENFLYVTYLCQKDLKKRSYAYMFSSVLDDIKYHKTVLKDFSKNGGAKTSSLNGAQICDIEELISHKQSLFQKPGFDDAYAYYCSEKERRRQANIKRRLENWYSYYNGPENIRELSKELGVEFAYSFFYSKYSKLAHGNETFLGKMVSTGQNSADMYQLRSFISIHEVLVYVFMFSTTCLVKYVSTVFPERSNELKLFQVWRERQLKIINESQKNRIFPEEY